MLVRRGPVRRDSCWFTDCAAHGSNEVPIDVRLMTSRAQPRVVVSRLDLDIAARRMENRFWLIVVTALFPEAWIAREGSYENVEGGDSAGRWQARRRRRSFAPAAGRRARSWIVVACATMLIGADAAVAAPASPDWRRGFSASTGDVHVGLGVGSASEEPGGQRRRHSAGHRQQAEVQLASRS